MKGFVKLWRNEGFFDLAMPDVQYKVWMALQLRAQHAPYRGRRAGDLQVSYHDLQEMLTREDGSTVSPKEIKKALDNLVARGYILRKSDPGKPLLIRIVDWAGMQGKHPEKYEYLRPGHELPPVVDDDPFASGNDTSSPAEVEHFPEGSTSPFDEEGHLFPEGSTKVVHLASRKGHRERKNAKNDPRIRKNASE